jgi:hypothetical protein
MKYSPPKRVRPEPGRWYRGVTFVILAGLVLGLASCSKGRRTVHPVRGRVVDAAGKPAAGALVIFHPSDDPDHDPNKPRGTTDAEGYFSLTTYEQGDGAPEGDYNVTVEWRPRKKTPFSAEPADKLGGRYNNPGTTPFRGIHMDAETREFPPFKLK